MGRGLRAGLQDTNGTEPLSLTDLPANILETFIPGYSIISRYILATFGFDISIIVSTGLILFAGYTGWNYMWSAISAVFGRYCMSSIHIDDRDDLYDNILKWIAEQHMSKVARSLKAKSPRGSAWDDEQDDDAAEGALDSEGNFNFGQWQARVPPRFEPYYGRHRFWHKGHFFVFHRSQKQKQVIQGPWGGGKEDDLLEIRCIGLTTQPIKDLLQEIKLWSLRKQFSRTTIRNPSGKDRGRAQGAWSKVSSRPSRPMATVILDAEQKAMIIKDMNEFLHPSSPKWYATRGIPYRRGYLFHGPPGTGKTSLSFALAGIFGLEIYCIALNDPEMNETDLMQLFNHLPSRCIVLLEDIDEAGVKRKDKSDTSDGKTKKKEGKEDEKTLPNGDGKESDHTNDKQGDGKKEEAKKDDDTNWTLQDLARALKAVANESPAPPAATKDGPRRLAAKAAKDKDGTTVSTGISLSGLLNAIDGVATHEGRILIMTTNHPEKLDAALIRSGRVDMQIRFTFAKRAQIQELFLRMYAVDLDTSSKLQELDLGLNYEDEKKTTQANGHGPSTNGHAVRSLTDSKTLARDELQSIAEQFAEKLPEEQFPPADIQGFLLLHKKHPRKALEKVEEWRDEELAKRAEKEEADTED